MELWTTAEMHELARALEAAGDAFYVRRRMQRLETGDTPHVLLPTADQEQIQRGAHDALSTARRALLDH